MAAILLPNDSLTSLSEPRGAPFRVEDCVEFDGIAENGKPIAGGRYTHPGNDSPAM